MSGECGAARRLILDRSAVRRFDESRLAAERHAAGCAACRSFMAESEATTRLIKQSVASPAPVHLRERVFDAIAAARSPGFAPRRIQHIVAATICVSVAGLVLGYGFWNRPDMDVTIATIAADHAITAVDDHIVSGSTIEIEAWLTDRVSHAVMVPTLSGAVVVGARTSVTPQGKSAVVEYEIDGRRVSYFVLLAPSGAAANERVRVSASRGYSIAHWRDRGLVHAFVGALPPNRVKSLAEECIHQAQSRGSALFRPRETPPMAIRS